MARLYDSKDVRIVALTIRSVRPDSTSQAADMVLEACVDELILPSDLIEAIERYRKNRE